jgi:vancomycin resistance protein YoaR
MAGLRSGRLVLVLTLLLIFTGCGGNIGNEKLSYEKPETTEKPEAVRMPDAFGAPEAAETPEAVVKNNVFLGSENVGGRRISELPDMLEKYAAQTDTAPVNAAVNRKTWAVTPGKTGKRLNVGKTIDALKNAGEGDRIDYVFDTVQPSVRAADLKKKIRVIGKYTTVLLDRRDSRVNNIRLASGRINNTILEPGEEFSFNGIVGKRTAAKGYEEAPIIIRTPSGPKKKNAKGGGVCQISTTLYNAVEECGLKVTERHMHSKDVGYVPRGDDATVSYGSVDFRFVNSRSHPIMLKLGVSGKYLKVRILENSAI